MNEEVKEIYLSKLEWTKTHDNMGGVICNLIFKDIMSYDDYQKLFKTTYFVLCNKDYITSLEEENKKYRRLGFEHLCKKNTKLEQRIDKALKCIDENAWFCYKDNEEVIDRVAIKELKDILKGSDK